MPPPSDNGRTRPGWGAGSQAEAQAARHRQATANQSHATAPGHLSFDDLPQLDRLAEARRRRDEGTRGAEAAAHTGYRLLVDDAIDQLAASGREFTAEDVRAIAGDPIGTGPNALGGMIAGAARRGVIVAVGFAEATRPQAHARVVRVWRGAA